MPVSLSTHLAAFEEALLTHGDEHAAVAALSGAAAEVEAGIHQMEHPTKAKAGEVGPAPAARQAPSWTKCCEVVQKEIDGCFDTQSDAEQMQTKMQELQKSLEVTEQECQKV